MKRITNARISLIFVLIGFVNQVRGAEIISMLDGQTVPAGKFFLEGIKTRVNDRCDGHVEIVTARLGCVEQAAPNSGNFLMECPTPGSGEVFTAEVSCLSADGRTVSIETVDELQAE